MYVNNTTCALRPEFGREFLSTVDNLTLQTSQYTEHC